MTTVEKIKAKILDLAIRGKLVPQNPDDEPASVLLGRIKAEKAKLVKAGKIKKDKNPSEIVVGSDGATYEKFADGKEKDISEEIPFELPRGWAWTRLGHFAFITKLAGFEYSKTISHALTDKGIPLLKGKNVQGSKLIELYEDYIPNAVSMSLPRSRISRKCLLLPYVGTIGNVAIFDKRYIAHLGSNVAKIEFDVANCIAEEYVVLILRSPTGYKLLTRDKKATAQESLSMSALRDVLIPLPPLAEQKRIVVEVDQLFARADIIGDASDEISQTAQRLDEKILDLAIKGQLVPQDPNDEPASELIKRIEAAKKATAKGRKSSRIAASDRPAYETEPPFDIPDSWEWVRLGDVILPMETKRPQGETFQYIDIDAIDNANNVVLTPKRLPVAKAPSRASRGLKSGDTLFSVVRPYLRNIAYIDDSLADCIASTGFYVCRPNEMVDPRFLFWLLLSDYVVNGLNSFMKGDNSPSIRGEQLHDFLVPLPPLAAQKRIVAKIKELRAMTRSLTK